MINYIKTGFGISERRSCQLVGLSRIGFRYQVKVKDEQRLRLRLKELASQYPRYGYLLLHNLLKAEGLVINKKRTYRLYTEEKLQVHTQKRKKLTRPRVVMDAPLNSNERWSMDFVSDQLSNGRRFRVLNIVDEGLPLRVLFKRNDRTIDLCIHLGPAGCTLSRRAD